MADNSGDGGIGEVDAEGRRHGFWRGGYGSFRWETTYEHGVEHGIATQWLNDKMNYKTFWEHGHGWLSIGFSDDGSVRQLTVEPKNTS